MDAPPRDPRRTRYTVEEAEAALEELVQEAKMNGRSHVEISKDSELLEISRWFGQIRR